MSDSGGIEGGTVREREEPPKKKHKKDRTADLEDRAETMRVELAHWATDIAELKKTATTVPDIKLGSMTVTCVNVGQGDCTLVVTPSGRRFLIDCGFDPRSTSPGQADKFNGIKNSLIDDAVRSAGFLKDTTVLHTLVLTHADVDHNSRIAEALDGCTIYHVYHSGIYGKYQQQTQKLVGKAATPEPSTDGGTVDPNATEENPPIKQLVCRWTNKDNHKAGTQTAQILLRNKPVAKYGTDADSIDFPVTGGIRIWREEKCTVTVLAAGVAPKSYTAVQDAEGVSIQDGSNAENEKNTGSVVTLFQAFSGADTKKVLICGDTTRSTEQYLLDTHADAIKDVDLLLVPHHGSATTSSAPDFIAQVNPKNAVISAGGRLSQYRHPRWATVKRYLEHFVTAKTAPVAAHTVVCFATEEETRPRPPDEKEQKRLGITALKSVEAVKAGCFEITITYPLYMTPIGTLLTDGKG
ncbi:ComEC/Rec2 family competence protein [Streptomyces sp. NPDC021080]|uniref:ComEC/Rec2 family competence protein n=1 Tax=Streptomyces sp. NPDC021080 TaxID=3365110 RepID=UPI003790246D